MSVFFSDQPTELIQNVTFVSITKVIQRLNWNLKIHLIPTASALAGGADRQPHSHHPTKL